MRVEMKKLNRIKYARSEEELKKLASGGYVPVDSPQAVPLDPEQGAGDPAGQTVSPNPEQGDRRSGRPGSFSESGAGSRG